MRQFRQIVSNLASEFRGGGTPMAARTCVVVGGGLAGATAAFTLRSHGFDGRIVVVCEEHHQPYSRPPLSKGVVRGEIPERKAFLRPEHWYETQGIELLVGCPATRLDPHEQQIELRGGDRIHYDYALLATGSKPRTLPSPADIPNVVTLRTLDDARALRERLGTGRTLLVVGGGFVGAELAASARSVGTEVTVLEAEPRPLSRLLPAALGETYARLHRERGVRLLTRTTVKGLARHGHGIRALDSHGGHHTADTAVIAIGSTPDTALAQRAGLAVENGIVVDEYCRTGAPGVYAAGDVANHPNFLLGRRIRIEHWQNAQHQAAAAARGMLGHHEVFAEIPWVWSDQFDVNLQIAGIPRPTDTVVLRGEVDSMNFTAFLLRDEVLVAAIGLNRAGDVRAARRLIARGYRPDAARLSDKDSDLEALADDAAASA
jgi:3-phenylpropionate/trans-cinnamate dioxygenase ferredoxin reductase subunit